MFAEIPAIYRTVAQAATHEIGNPEWEEHRSLTLRFLETAILHTIPTDLESSNHPENLYS